VKSKRPSTADKLLSFRERLSKHYAAARRGIVTPRPSVDEFTGFARGMALDIAESEQRKHEAAVAADESFKKLGYKS